MSVLSRFWIFFLLFLACTGRSSTAFAFFLKRLHLRHNNFFGFAGIGFASRQIANLAKPNLVFSTDDQGVISMKSITTFKTAEIHFRLDEEFDELTPDDRQAKVDSIKHF